MMPFNCYIYYHKIFTYLKTSCSFSSLAEFLIISDHQEIKRKTIKILQYFYT